jgi:amino-acid N-acetyltransferase
MVYIRPAAAADARTIRAMVYAERLDPTGLNWRRFLVAEADGHVVGIGQVREYGGCRELGSLVVLPAYRERGIASRLIAELEAGAGLPLYLFCASRVEAFYRRHGYRRLSAREVPPPLWLKLAPALLARLAGLRILVMRKDGYPRQSAAGG